MYPITRSTTPIARRILAMAASLIFTFALIGGLVQGPGGSLAGAGWHHPMIANTNGHGTLANGAWHRPLLTGGWR